MASGGELLMQMTEKDFKKYMRENFNIGIWTAISYYTLILFITFGVLSMLGCQFILPPSKKGSESVYASPQEIKCPLCGDKAKRIGIESSLYFYKCESDHKTSVTRDTFEIHSSSSY